MRGGRGRPARCPSSGPPSTRRPSHPGSSSQPFPCVTLPRGERGNQLLNFKLVRNGRSTPCLAKRNSWVSGIETFHRDERPGNPPDRPSCLRSRIHQVCALTTMATPSITRENVLAFRQRATHLTRRLPSGRLVEAAFAGLQDSAPRSAVLALYARVKEVSPSAWKDPRFVQVWGPRGAVYVVPAHDVAVFTLGRFPRNSLLGAAVKAAAEKAKRAFRARQARPGRNLSDRAVGVNFRELRIASMTGAVRIEWDGATTSWRLVEPPTEAPELARLELARRFLRSVGPSTPKEFAWWSGGWAGSFGASTRGELSDAQQTFRSLEKELTEVEFEGQKGWTLRTDRARLERAVPVETVRLLPAGDPFLASADQALLVPQPRFRSELWPKSVWPGALLVNGELVGTWRRQMGRVTVRAWVPLEPEVKEGVEDEVSGMPIESATKEVRWSAGDVPL